MGSVMSYSLGLGADRPAPAGILAFSGLRARRRRLGADLADRAGLRAFIAHGRRDPVMEVDFARRARELLEAGGLASSTTSPTPRTTSTPRTSAGDVVAGDHAGSRPGLSLARPVIGLGDRLPTRRGRMADSVYRVTEVIGVSSESWEAAARGAVETAAKSVRDLRIAEVRRQDVTIGDGGVVNFRVRLAISFKFKSSE